MKKISKVLFIDIGSHECQEIKALTQSSILLSLLYFKRYVINFFVKGLIVPPIIDFLDFLKIRKKLLKRIDFCFVAIEPNWRHYRCQIYKKLSYVFCFGLQKMNNDIEMKHLSFKSLKKNDQGASLFKAPGNSDLSDVITVLDTDYFCKHVLQKIVSTHVDEGMTRMVLRLNCEGTEDDVIYSVNQIFSDQLVGILGSLDDVKKKKGDIKADALDEYLLLNSIDFCRFSSNMSTWPKTIKFLENKLK